MNILTSEDLFKLGDVLTGLNKITNNTGISFCTYGRIDISTSSGVVLKINHIDGKHVIDLDA